LAKANRLLDPRQTGEKTTMMKAEIDPSAPAADVLPGLLSRRKFLQYGALMTAALVVPKTVRAAVNLSSHEERRLRLFNTHTGERLTACYSRGENYDAEALNAINHILRDHRTNEIKPIDVRLLDLLCAIRRRAGQGTFLDIISGYRSPATNRMLRRHSSGVASKSLHMQGYAADIRITGMPLAQLRQIAVDLNRGGVGFYPASGFVHVDIGHVRRW
jgi:uncharacterized protein YcbK (DUF882 family)